MDCIKVYSNILTFENVCSFFVVVVFTRSANIRGLSEGKKGGKYAVSGLLRISTENTELWITNLD